MFIVLYSDFQNELFVLYFHLIFADIENLATEIEVWKDMKKIKHLPAPLSQKKAMRLQYQVRKISFDFIASA